MRNKEQSFGFYLSAAHRLSRANINKRVIELGLSPSQIPLMAGIFDHPGGSQDELSRKHAIDKGAVARQLLKLEEIGLISREIDKNNRRCNLIYPTAKGLTIKKDFFQMLNDLNDLSLAGFDPEERKLVLKFMQRVLSNQQNQ